MKSAIITSTIVVASCALLTAAAPAGHPDSNLVARGSKVSKVAKPLEKWALNPQSMTDRDQRKKNREDAVKIATGSGSGSATRQRHPELQKAMNAIKATNAFAEAGKKKKRAVYDEEFEARDFEDFESELVARASKAAGIGKAIGKAAEKFILNPQSMADRDQRKKNRDNAITLATGGNTGGGARTRHPEIQKAMDAAKFKGLPGKKKRAFDDMTDRDQRKKNRDNAITLATGGNTGGGARTRHPEIQKAMDAAKFKGTKKRALEEEVEAREFDEEFEARDFDDFEGDIFAREFYGLDELD
ncbi:hypothetical protein BDQ12DRAFT_692784 [Crucibulum laeve]|uniref:Uncharacterized protein n=1 Tax=Crucibulum laeve TaxID=68775 RepID=A0A5C3LHV6_9AGAR|nr:hypothetical protein BDQ12DRAFT_692784 [Crucibulum laeve]